MKPHQLELIQYVVVRNHNRNEVNVPMKFSAFWFAGALAAAVSVIAAEPEAAIVGGAVPVFNRKAPSPHISASSSFGDTVIAHVADGGGWQTIITVLNLRSTATSFTVACF